MVFHGIGKHGYSTLRGYQQRVVLDMSISYQDLYGHVQNGKAVPGFRGATSISEGKLHTGDPALIRQNHKHLERLETKKVEITGKSRREKNINLVEEARTNALSKVVQEELAKQISTVYLEVLKKVQTALDKAGDKKNAESDTLTDLSSKGVASDQLDKEADSIRGDQETSEKSDSNVLTDTQKGEILAKIDLHKDLLQQKLQMAESDNKVAQVLGTSAVSLASEFIDKAKKEIKTVLKTDSGDPVDDAQSVNLSNDLKNAFKGFVEKQVSSVIDPDTGTSSLSSVSGRGADLKQAITDAVDTISDQKINQVVGLLDLQDSLNQDDRAQAVLVPQTALLSVTKKADELQINAIGNTLKDQGNEKVPKQDESDIKEIVSDLISRGLPRQKEVKDFVKSTFKDTDEEKSGSSLSQEIKDTLDQTLKYLQRPEPILRDNSETKIDDKDKSVITDLGQNESVGKDKNQKDDSDTKRLDNVLDPLRQSLGSDHPDVIAITKLLKPYINEHLRVHTGEVFPGFTRTDEAEHVSKTKGPVAHPSIFHEGLTDHAQVFSAYWNYQNIKVRHTDRLSEQVPHIYNKEDRPRSEQNDFEDTMNNFDIVLDVQHSVDTNPVIKSEQNLSLPPIHERYSTELEERFSDNDSDDGPKKTPDDSTGRGGGPLWS